MSDDHAIVPPVTVTEHPAPRRRFLFWGGTIVLVIVAGGLMSRLWHRSGTSGAGPAASSSADSANRPVPVVIAEATEKDVPIYLTGLGNALPLSTVTVRSQVDGRLDRVLFKEGQSVKAGDVLAEIDPRPYAIQLHQAQAALARDTAQLQNARVALARNQALRENGIIPQQQLDDQQALVNQYEAGLKGDQAQIENARLLLDYARVRSPINGVTGVRLVDAGNLVHANDATGLVVVTQLDPMAVTFNLPQDDLIRVNRALAQGPLPIQVSNRDGAQVLGNGTLSLVDNQVNTATATVKLKATVPNPDRAIWPQQFVKVRLLVETRKNALVVPATAVQRGPEGSLVYVVTPQDTATPRKVELESLQENFALIAKGLTRGEKVVVEGQGQLRANSKVMARPAATDKARSPSTTEKGAEP